MNNSNNSVKYVKSLAVDLQLFYLLQELPFSINGTRRICLHDSPTSKLHTMVIEVKEGEEYPAHFHSDSDEIMFVLSGKMEVLVWENGMDQMPTRINLDSSLHINQVVMIPRLAVHVTKPVSQCLYLEVKLGPFDKDNLQLIDRGKLKY